MNCIDKALPLEHERMEFGRNAFAIQLTFTFQLTTYTFKQWLNSQRFQTDEKSDKLAEVTNSRLFLGTYKELMQWNKKCMEVNCDYIKK